jgi:3',5'-cyclic AMP phosphodiesterase CpdA
MSLLFHLSDLHFGREDKGALAWVKALVEVEKPDALIVTGDLTMRARSHEFGAAAAWLKSLATPMTIEPGNHDLPLFNPWHRIMQPYARIEGLAQAIEQPTVLNDVWIVPLKTTRRAQWRLNWASGAVSQKALTLALEWIARKPFGMMCVITCHHPLIAIGKMYPANCTVGGAQALNALALAGANAVLSGHVHDPFAVEWKTGVHRVHLIGAGTLSERVRTSRPSFNQISICNGKLSSLPRFMDLE